MVNGMKLNSFFHQASCMQPESFLHDALNGANFIVNKSRDSNPS